ncbi:MAG: hypothetical protein SFY66_10715 [Oculatellaceae cyanobacterium bins.114]|nr:hypothetical protein [Oculatellaceae cyanobacterium bins.114]
MTTQIALKKPVIPAEKTIFKGDRTVEINGFNLIADQTQRYAYGYCELLVIIENRITGEGLVIDLLCPGNGGFAVVLNILNLHFPSGTWRYVEARKKSAKLQEVIAA